jgi:hypothetical protein
MRRALAPLAALLLAGCGNDGPARARPVPESVTWTAPGAAPAAAPRPRPRLGAGLPREAPRPAPPRPAVMAPPVTPPQSAVDWTNRQGPIAGDWLTAQGRALFAAIAANDPARARGFFFPRKPFTPLKQSGNPDRYWQHIYALYEKDIRRLHRRRADWTGATYESLTPGTRPAWVKPGQVHNKIGYFRTRFARLRYRLGGKRYSLFLHTLITWQGLWYVTHLLPPPPRRRPRPRP